MNRSANRTFNVLIAGWVGSENSGDEAIFSSLISNLKKLDVGITAFTLNERKTHRIYKINTVPFEIFHNPSRFLKAILNTDLLVVGGGGILQDETSIFNTFRYLYKAGLGILFRKKVVFYGVGVGPINYRLTSIAIRLVLNRVHAVTVRDNKSKELLTKTGVSPRLIEVTFDPAISLTSIPKEESKRILNKEITNKGNKQVVGICLRHWFDTHPFIPVSFAQKISFKQNEGKEKYEEFIKNIANNINEINETGEYIFLFIPFWYSRDSKVHNDVIKLLKDKSNVYALSKEYTPSELLGLFSQLDMVLAMRLHACIFAAAAQTPFVALSYTSKVNNFLQEIGFENYQLNITNLTKDSIFKKIKLLQKNKVQLKKQLLLSVNKAQEKEKLNYEYIKNFKKII
jgi:polysaccharide pyruvyl transferase CsaB